MKVFKRGRVSFPGAFAPSDGDLGALALEVRKERLGHIEWTGMLAFLVLSFAHGDAAIDYPALRWCVFVVRSRKFGKDGDHAAGQRPGYLERQARVIGFPQRSIPLCPSLCQVGPDPQSGR